jgi:hypothetical protein
LADRLACPEFRGPMLQPGKSCCDAGGSVWQCRHEQVARTHGGRVTLTPQPGVELDACSECEFRPRPE